MHHKAWEAGRLRALNGVLDRAGLQPEELLLEAVEAPWEEVSDEESSGGEVGVGSPLYPRGLAPEGVRDVARGQDGRGKQQQKGGSRGQEGAGGWGQGDSKWSMPGFSVDPGGAALVAGRYIVKAVQSQVILQGPASREIWLGVDLRRGRGRIKITGWMQSGELQRRAAGNGGWLAKLRGKGREGWSVEGHNWACSEGPTMTGHHGTWAERSSGGMVPASAGGGRRADEEWRSQSGGNDEESDSGQVSWRV